LAYYSLATKSGLNKKSMKRETKEGRIGKEKKDHKRIGLSVETPPLIPETKMTKIKKKRKK